MCIKCNAKFIFALLLPVILLLAGCTKSEKNSSPINSAPASDITDSTIEAEESENDPTPLPNEVQQIDEIYKTENGIGPFRWLRKISRKIRGLDPQKSEYDELRSLLQSKPLGQLKQSEIYMFMHNKAKSYTASEQHVEKMNFRLAALFYLRTFYIPASLKAENFPQSLREEYERSNNQTVTSLFKNIIRNNLSWDELLVGRKYEVFENGFFDVDGDSDISFYSTVENRATLIDRSLYDFSQTLNPNLLSGDPRQFYEFSDSDPQIAGVLSTRGWRKRYTATDINENRRNSSNVFRIFLCDPMKPAVFADPQEEILLTEEFLKIVQTGTPTTSATPDLSSPEIQELIAKAHGTEASCVGCHQKTDPPGLVFGEANSSFLPENMTKGKLFYNYSDTEKADLEVDGLRGLAKAIVAQNRYLDCQVRHFWDWFISREITDRPSSSRMEELKLQFNNFSRKPNDFVAYLVTQPEFYSDRSKENVIPTYDQVKPILQKCLSCHQASAEEVKLDVSLPNFKTTEDQTRLKKILSRMSLPKTQKKFMPQNPEEWSEKELQAVKAWIKYELETTEGWN